MANVVTFFGVALVVAVWGAQATGAQDRTLELLRKRHQDRHAEFALAMQELADFCAEQSFLTDAEQIRLRARPVSAGAFDLDELPSEVLPDLPPTLADAERQWRTKLRKLEDDYATDLYKLARDALTGLRKQPSFAFQLMREVAFHNPDHEHARRALGFVRDKNTWTTPFERKMKVQKNVNHPQFGWLPERYVSRYDNGERYFNGDWMSVEREASIRTNFRYAWEVQSEHFHIFTNHSLEKGVEISRALEEFHRFFIREFAAFFNTPQQMQRLFEGGLSSRRVTPRLFRVYYYKEQEEFVRNLERRQPNAVYSNGIYMPNDRVAYFFHQDDTGTNYETMFHEVTHQLLGESTSQVIDAGRGAHFWLVEGIACYMESLQHEEDGQLRVGDPHHARNFWARHEVVENEFYVRMSDFTGLGMEDFQNPANIEILRKYYAQATGMTHFFLHFQEGAYRDAFLVHLAQLYHPSPRVRHRPQSLPILTGVPYATLDEQYISYVRTFPATPPPSVQVIYEETPAD